MTTSLPQETQTLYAELLEQLLAESTRRTIGKARGTFTTKTIHGEDYVYFQYSTPGGRFRQMYLGKSGPELNRLIERFRKERPSEEKTRENLERLCAQVLAGGAWTMGSAPARVLKSFSDAGVFDTGGVLVGTHAFGIIGNLLGMRWERPYLRTQDIDLGAVSLAAAAEDGSVDAPKALERLKMGFLPVPGLDPRRPSTSFKVRGQSLRVDFLTPGKGDRPVFVGRLGTGAQPLPYLDYLIELPERAAALEYGGFLVLVPKPARFALHKLMTAGERPGTQQTKVEKDLAQAAEILDHLAEVRPGDVRLAAEELRRRKWRKRLDRIWNRLVGTYPKLKRVKTLLD